MTRLARTATLGLLLAAAALVTGFVVFAETLDGTGAAPPPRADGIVALTGGADRIADALGLLLSGDGRRLLISGVNPATSVFEVTRAAPEARRLLNCCIELGYAAATTIGNARETRAWARRYDIRSLIVVTSNYHMPRALAEIADALPGVDLVPFPVAADHSPGVWWSDPQHMRLVLAEYLKYVAVLARVHLYPAAPYADDDA